MGCTLYRYLLDRKLDYSFSLLKEGKNVTEACYLLGFNSSSFYIEAFRRRFFGTPYKYVRSFLRKD